MRAFLICPVRGHDPAETEALVKKLEDDGWEVYWPHRDTCQDDEVGLNICGQNRLGIIEADKVFVVWDGKSQGCLFDLGVAFAFQKPIAVLEAPAPTLGKSFQNMMRVWEESL